MKAPTVCSTPGCANEVERGRCADCERQRRAARPRHDFYKSDYWRKRSRAYRRRHPICEEPGCTNPSQEVHHINGDTDDNSDANTQALCKSCHGKINLQPYAEREKSTRRYGPVPVAPRGPSASKPIVGGGLLDQMMKRKAKAT